MSCATFHSPPTFFQTVTKRPLSSRSPFAPMPVVWYSPLFFSGEIGF